MSRKDLPRNPGRHRIEKDHSSERRILPAPTAIPAFVGYTRSAEDGNGNSLNQTPVLVATLDEFEEKFGGGPDFRFSLESTQEETADFELTGQKYNWVPSHLTTYEISTIFYLYSSLKFYFANGGGQCYIVSVGQYETYTLREDVLGLTPQKNLIQPDADALIEGIAALESVLKPSPTIILVPDAQLLEQEECYRVQQATLAHCGAKRDRIALFDVWGGKVASPELTEVAAFRAGIGEDHLEFGVGYYPWVQTLLYGPESVSYYNMMNATSLLPELFPGRKALGELRKLVSDLKALKLYLRVPPPDRKGNGWVSWPRMFMENPQDDSDLRAGPAWRVKVLLKMWDMLLDLGIERKFPVGKAKIANDDIINYIFTLITPAGPLAYYLGQIYLHDLEFPEGPVGVMTDEVLAKYEITPPKPDGSTYPVVDPEDANGRMEGFLIMIFQIFSQAIESVVDKAHALLLEKDNAFAATNPNYKRLMQSLADAANVLPVTGGLAGLYVENDAGKGVWNAPTNIAIKKVSATCAQIANKEQEKLNHDPVGGKSMNAIRSFFGRGAATVYGARTLAGNHPDARYLPDKRTLIYIEQSIEQTMPTLAGMPNTEATWGEVKRILKRFLKKIWRSRGLQGDSKEEAYKIEVGLDETMTQQEVDSGLLKVRISVAPAVPMEFIVLEFQQQLS